MRRLKVSEPSLLTLMPRLVRLLMSDELVYFSVVWVVSVVSRIFEVTFNVPAVPGVCDVNDK